MTQHGLELNELHSVDSHILDQMLGLACRQCRNRKYQCDATPCRKGEELVQSYRERSNRNDIALLHHFFLNERRPALMCAHDFPDAAAHLVTQQTWTDAHYMPGGPLSTKVCRNYHGTGVLPMCAASAWPHDDALPHVCPITSAAAHAFACLCERLPSSMPAAYRAPTPRNSVATVDTLRLLHGWQGIFHSCQHLSQLIRGMNLAGGGVASAHEAGSISDN